MTVWIQIIRSSTQYQDLFKYIYEEGDSIYSGINIVIHGVIRCKDGREIGKKNKYTHILTFLAFSEKIIEKIVSTGLSDYESIFEISDISDNERVQNENASAIVDDYSSDNYQVCLFKKGKSFKFESDLNEYLNKINFKYEDGSLFKHFVNKFKREGYTFKNGRVYKEGIETKKYSLR